MDFGEGFIDPKITDAIVGIRAENADWFKIAEDLNSVLVGTATAAANAAKTTSMAPEAVAVRILLRSCGMLQAAILLTERGMVAEGRTLVRSLMENAFCVAALHDNPDIFMEMLKKDSEASRHLALSD